MEKEKEGKKRVESFRPFRLELARAAGKASKLFPDALTLSCEHPFKEPIDSSEAPRQKTLPLAECKTISLARFPIFMVRETTLENYQWDFDRLSPDILIVVLLDRHGGLCIHSIEWMGCNHSLLLALPLLLPNCRVIIISIQAHSFCSLERRPVT